MKKMHLITYPVTAFIALGIGAATADSSTTPTQTKTVTKTVAQAPAECETALDLSNKFALAVGKEHDAMGEAFTRAGEDGDMFTMATSITDAVDKFTSTTTDLTGPMGDAVATCRAAVK